MCMFFALADATSFAFALFRLSLFFLGQSVTWVHQVIRSGVVLGCALDFPRPLGGLRSLGGKVVV